ncbi:MAG: hypothetical protein LBQ51_00865 [Desulfovibrio sp.]|nr:hypothetical protein [Desulfovibrio sp.]
MKKKYALFFLCLLPAFAASCADRESGVAAGLGTGGAGATFFNSGAYFPTFGAWGGRGFRRSFGGVFLSFPLSSFDSEYIPPVPAPVTPTAPASAPSPTASGIPPRPASSASAGPALMPPPTATDIRPAVGALSGDDHLPMAVLSRKAWEYRDALYRSRLADYGISYLR